MSETKTPTQLLTVEETCRMLAVCRRTLDVLPIRRVRVGPRLVRYRLADVEAYIAKRLREAA